MDKRRKQTFTDAKSISEKINEFKNKLEHLVFWGDKYCEGKYITYAKVTDKEQIQELLNKIELSRILKISVCYSDIDIYITTWYLYKLIEKKDTNYM